MMTASIFFLVAVIAFVIVRELLAVAAVAVIAVSIVQLGSWFVAS